MRLLRLPITSWTTPKNIQPYSQSQKVDFREVLHQYNALQRTMRAGTVTMRPNSLVYKPGHQHHRILPWIFSLLNSSRVSRDGCGRSIYAASTPQTPQVCSYHSKTKGNVHIPSERTTRQAKYLSRFKRLASHWLDLTTWLQVLWERGNESLTICITRNKL